MAKKNGQAEEKTSNDIKPPENSGGLMVAEADDQTATGYEDGFYEVIVTDPDKKIPNGTIVPLTRRYDHGVRRERTFGFAIQREMYVHRMRCMSAECPTKNGHEWTPEPMFRPTRLCQIVPEENRWLARWSEKQYCPACKAKGRESKGFPKKVGFEFARVEVRQVWWLTAAERAEFDVVMDPKRKGTPRHETWKTELGQVRTMVTGYEGGPFMRRIKRPNGVFDYVFYGSMVSLRYLGAEYEQGANFAFDTTAQNRRLNEIMAEMARVSSRIASEEKPEKRTQLAERINALNKERESIMSSVNNQLSGKEEAAA